MRIGSAGGASEQAASAERQKNSAHSTRSARVDANHAEPRTAARRARVEARLAHRREERRVADAEVERVVAVVAERRLEHGADVGGGGRRRLGAAATAALAVAAPRLASVLLAAAAAAAAARRAICSLAGARVGASVLPLLLLFCGGGNIVVVGGGHSPRGRAAPHLQQMSEVRVGRRVGGRRVERDVGDVDADHAPAVDGRAEQAVDKVGAAADVEAADGAWARLCCCCFVVVVVVSGWLLLDSMGAAVCVDGPLNAGAPQYTTHTQHSAAAAAAATHARMCTHARTHPAAKRASRGRPPSGCSWPCSAPAARAGRWAAPTRRRSRRPAARA